MTTQHLNVPESSRETWRARQRGNRMRERERMRERAVDKVERKRRTGRNREGRYWPMCGGVMVAIRGSVPFVSPRAPIHHRASNHHCAMYLYTFTVCTYICIYMEPYGVYMVLRMATQPGRTLRLSQRHA